MKSQNPLILIPAISSLFLVDIANAVTFTSSVLNPADGAEQRATFSFDEMSLDNGIVEFDELTDLSLTFSEPSPGFTFNKSLEDFDNDFLELVESNGNFTLSYSLSDDSGKLGSEFVNFFLDVSKPDFPAGWVGGLPGPFSGFGYTFPNSAEVTLVSLDLPEQPPAPPTEPTPTPVPEPGNIVSLILVFGLSFFAFKPKQKEHFQLPPINR